jgi:hypothetical protein
MHHQPVAERLLARLRDHYGIDPVAAMKLSSTAAATRAAFGR